MKVILVLFGFALLPALHVQEIAIITFGPGEFLATDGHVFRKFSLDTVRVLVIDNKTVDVGKGTDRDGDEEGQLDPTSHFVDIFFDAMFSLHQFLLVSNAGTNLLEGFGLHFSFSTEFGNSLGITALQGNSRPSATDGQSGSSSTERLSIIWTNNQKKKTPR